MQLKWVKCQGEVWCPLSTVNLAHAHFDILTGVYIIWHTGQSPATVYVGRGKIRDCLIQDRLDQNIQAYANLGLLVTWAAVSPASQDGVVVYLKANLNPKLVRRFPPSAPVEVNPPW